MNTVSQHPLVVSLGYTRVVIKRASVKYEKRKGKSLENAEKLVLPTLKRIKLSKLLRWSVLLAIKRLKKSTAGEWEKERKIEQAIEQAILCVRTN